MPIDRGARWATVYGVAKMTLSTTAIDTRGSRSVKYIQVKTSEVIK